MRHHESSLRLAAALLGSTILAARQDPPTSQPAEPAPLNLLLITVDTLRPDRLGCYGHAPYPEPVSPAIDSFAAEGFLLERCFAPRGETSPSLCSMMTGLFPSNHGVIENHIALDANVTTLADLLLRKGFTTAGFAGMLPGSPRGRASRGFSTFTIGKDEVGRGRQSEWDQVAEDAAITWLRKLKREPRRFFAWVHFFDVHGPYSPTAPHDRTFAGDYDGPMKWTEDAGEGAYNRAVREPLEEAMVARRPLEPADAAYVRSLYDGGIRNTDDRILRILRTLDRSGLGGSTIVAFSADHGEELGDHNAFWYHAGSIYDSVLAIPLILRGPGIAKGRSDRLVQNLDLMPTLLQILGIEAPEGLDGVSFAELLKPELPPNPPREIVWSEWQELILTARTDRWKLVLNPKGARPKTPPYFGIEGDAGFAIDCFELYDLHADPGETKNVYREKRDEIDELRSLAVEEYVRRFAGKKFDLDAAVDLDEQKLLEELGYAAGGKRREDVVLMPESCKDEDSSAGGGPRDD